MLEDCFGNEVKDNLEVKNACFTQDIYNYGSRSLSVSESKYPGKRVYSVHFVAYYHEPYKGLCFSCWRNDRGAKSKAFFKEFDKFEDALDCFRNFNERDVIDQKEEYSYNGLYEFKPI